ncbi:MAG TPA: hypothetical protein H9722_01200 [Candidatus Mediterraneibacter pullistercoris]|nr:hypothetical protein [Candidatus Mediterraneibacter pullistercoris]
MRVIEALRYIHTEWVIFADMDEKDYRKVFTKPMKIKNITWDRLRRIEWKWVSSINFNKDDGILIIRYSVKRPIYERGYEK